MILNMQKIIVSDFDNTFFTDSYKKNIELVNDFVNKGNIFIIATGRPIYLLLNDLDRKIKYNYLICNDGAIMFDSNNEKIYELNIDNSVSKKIYNYLKKNVCLEKVYIDTGLDFSENECDIANGIVALPKDREDAITLIKKMVNEYHNINAYLSHKWLNILNKEATKGEAIKYLISINSWNIEDVITIGDNENDISMLEGFNSYAIKGNKNAENSSKYIVNSFEEMIDLLNKKS